LRLGCEGLYLALIGRPNSNGYLTIKASACDAFGNSIEQMVLRAIYVTVNP